jgi:hypothetical protein
MIAGGEDVQTEGEQLFGDGWSDAETTGCVFAISDGEVDAIGCLDVLKVVGDDVAAWRREDIADEEDVHA